jgi:hypothetical protein
MSFFKGWSNSPRVPAVHHRDDLQLMPGGERKVNGVWVHVGRDGDYLHVISFNGQGLHITLAPGAPVSALVEKIRNGDVNAALDRLAQRASRYAIKPRPWLTGKIKYPPTGLV